MLLIVSILSLVLLVCLWAVGDQEFRTKLILTGVWLLLGVLFFVDFLTGGWVPFACLALWCLVAGYWTFGSRFGRR